MIIVRFIILTKICVINRNNISYFGFLSLNLKMSRIWCKRVVCTFVESVL